MTAIAHADARTLPIVVHGPIDPETLRAAVARELGGDVIVVDACEAPCLAIDVAGGRASVAFTPVQGAPRARLVELGGDRAQWPVVITLLVGNVVRDEAADVLADLPDPDPHSVAEPPAAPPLVEPPPAPTAPPVVVVDDGVAPASVAGTLVAEPTPRESMLLSVGLVPGLSTDWTHVGRVDHVVSVDLIAGVSGGSHLLTLSGIADIEQGPVSGAQLGGVVALARRVGGLQVAGIAAVAGDLYGVQIAGTAAIADHANGLQIAGVASVARRDGGSQVAGVASVSKLDANLQLAGVAAAAGRDANLQVAGVAAVAKRDANLQIAGVASAATDGNLQFSGVASVAKRSANLQVAGLVNVARELDGVQIAPINVAKRVRGVQVGILNVGGSADGASFGLINIVPGGRADLEATVDSSSMGTLLFRHGGNGWHNVYGIGGHPVDETGPSDDVWMYGLGFGPSWRIQHTRIDLEAIGWEVSHGFRHSDDLSILGQLRLSLAHGIGPFAIVAGGALNAYISNDAQSPLFLERRTEPVMETREVSVEVWPSAFVGLRI
ncbi:MAG TPA: hypothetical protein VFQ53_29875 [Kofleriaceae bacterium]|nr:hypothetical protein [Kofleriaceae bacterium]